MRGGPPQIRDFSVNSQLVPGAQLSFTLEGTPKGRASVHTIRTGDRLSASDTLRATLQQRRRSTSKSYSAPWQAQTAAPAAAGSQEN